MPGDLSGIRARYAREIMGPCRRAGFDDPRVEAAFAAVPRERFVLPPPWDIFAAGGSIEARTADPSRLYEDVLVVLHRRKGINNGQPSLHAGWLAAAALRPGETVVQVGVGAGYYTAILVELVGPAGRLEAFEIDGSLARIARDNLRGLPQATVRHESGIGRVLPEADLVYVSAGAAAPDPHWLRALRPGGRLIFPWQSGGGAGTAIRLTRTGAGFAALPFMPGVSFIGCEGGGVDQARPRPFVPRRHVGETRSVWLCADRAPDGSATAIYDAVWFSADPVAG